jgi:hypothetical protein
LNQKHVLHRFLLVGMVEPKTNEKGQDRQLQ